MKNKSFWISIIAVFISFAGGFILANAFNRNELDALRAENARLKNEPEKSEQNQSELALTEEEIRQRIAEADQNPADFSFQKNLGLALYRYAAMKQDSTMLAEVEKILKRAYVLNEKDYEVAVALGNLQFDLGYIEKKNEGFAEARKYYSKVLEQNPKDVNVRTDYGLTYFLQTPPETEKAIAEFQKSLQENPKHEKTLQFLTQSLLQVGNTTEAEIYLAKLREIKPNTPSLAEFQAQMTQNVNAEKR
ncbi:MAG TPA: tetratricopeptide repeat protein [Pyrinomonadaceae bacterium]|jgi:tetratricopeptide (TPR) repeat protein